MELRGTEETTEIVLERMENSLGSLEQMSFDAINITDTLVNGIDEIMQCTDELANCQDTERERMLERIRKLLDALLATAFSVNKK